MILLGAQNGRATGKPPHVFPVDPGAVVAATIAIVLTVAVRAALPGFETHVLSAGAARLAAFFSCSHVLSTEAGYALPNASVPVVVSAACSAADFYVLLATLTAWQLTRARWPVVLAGAIAVTAALPLTVFVNALRIVAVAGAHRWIIPHFPPTYAALVHMATGVAVFLPALIAANLFLETYGLRHAPSRR